MSRTTAAASSLALVLALLVAAGAGRAGAQPETSTDPSSAPAGVYAVDKAHTSVTMKVSHLGLSYYTLRFDGVSGSLTWDPARPETSKLEVRIDPNSVDTGDPAFNRQIASEVFEAAKYPDIRFVSTAVRSSGEGRGVVVGDLSFHGQTRPVDLDVVFNGAATDPADHRLRLGFSGDATVRRSAFGATKYAPLVGDDVSVLVETEFEK